MELLNEKIKNECKISNTEYYENAIKKNGFFIGYLFIKTESENKRKNIPQSVRNSLWMKSYNDNINGNCYVCDCKITIHTFHAGHKISIKKGGTNNINNLEILCPSCNLSMGVQDLEEFKKTYF
jgi:5-methylcytosine-specific restriction endonuclease McrA